MDPSDKTLLKSKGLKATPARLRVLAALRRGKKPAGVHDLMERKEFAATDIVTVYRVLEAFVAAGIAREVNLRHGHADYELAEGHHHHAVCESCGRVENIGRCEVDVRASDAFPVINDHALELFGICRTCAA
jgi:Fe2+ or Zn2+ uptake regulation protein